jgi:ubiquinone biosynthesis protein UbiJ
VRDGSLELAGDAALAQSFQRLLWHARPDIEEELSGVIGDVAAHGLGDLARSVTDWSREARSTIRQNLSEYLQEESRAVPTRYEADRFRGEVEAMRDDVARLEARVKRLEQNMEADRDSSSP